MTMEVLAHGRWHWAGTFLLRWHPEVIERLGLIAPASVRNGPVFPLRGVPADISPLSRTQFDPSEPDEAYTWVSREELVELGEWHMRAGGPELAELVKLAGRPGIQVAVVELGAQDVRPGWEPRVSVWIRYMIESSELLPAAYDYLLWGSDAKPRVFEDARLLYCAGVPRSSVETDLRG